MIAIADLLQNNGIPKNYFAYDAYIQGDYESGLIENREGARLLSIPEVMIQGLYSALEDELGPAGSLVLFKWGVRWGKSFYRRFVEELSDCYHKPIAELEMVEFLQCFKQCWKTHGWGKLELELDYFQHGFLVVKTWNSMFAKLAAADKRPSCFPEAGILSGFFSQLTGRELHCVQTSCESMGATGNIFILGLPERLKVTDAWIKEKQDHEMIINRLCTGKAT
jgi:predicted hydrocarbon binding protein